jgi:hypothetical protein
MTTATATKTAKTWTCDGCGVSTTLAGGKATPMPDTWEKIPEGSFCLRCRRERAADEAAAGGSDREDRAKLRRASLIEFELRRAPERPNNIIARSCRSSPIAIAKVRKRLEAEAG